MLNSMIVLHVQMAYPSYSWISIRQIVVAIHRKFNHKGCASITVDSPPVSITGKKDC